MISIVHITTHLGGGVGRALSALTEEMSCVYPDVRHVFLCLEKLQKTQFAEAIQNAGGILLEEPSKEQIEFFINDADLVQVEWWNHPLLISTLTHISVKPRRIVVWAHQSGLVNPIFPKGLIEGVSRFILTSPCSIHANEIRKARPHTIDRIKVISSAGISDSFQTPERQEKSSGELSVGYVGSFNFSKLHPQFVDWLSEVNDPNFQVKMVGDRINSEVLLAQCASINRPNLLEFMGYSTQTELVIGGWDVTPYLLNPRHYGTAENSLLECMLMGVIPIVLNNHAEREIVSNGQTGFIVNSPSEFSEIINFLKNSPLKRSEISQMASREIRRRFSVSKMAEKFMNLYAEVLIEPMLATNFKAIFGESPSDWFLSCQESGSVFRNFEGFDKMKFNDLPHDVFDISKGSVSQFHQFFPEDSRLKEWHNLIEKKS